MDYLTQLYDRKLSWSTIGIHRSTISMTLAPIDGVRVGDSRNSVVCLFCLYYCLFTFHKLKQRKHTLWISLPSLHQMF
jgi:hypothetical protein